MWFKRCIVLVIIVILPCSVRAMDDDRPYDSSLVNKSQSSSDADIPTNSPVDKEGDAQETSAGNSTGFIKGLNQDDLAKKLLHNTDDLHRWMPRHKVALAVAIIAVCTSLGLSGYIVYDKVFAPKEGCSGDGHQATDQVVPEPEADEIHEK
jgi:hypothetical protein